MSFDGYSAELYSSLTAGDEPVHAKTTEEVAKAYDEAQIVVGNELKQEENDPFVVLSLGDGCGDPGLRIAEMLAAKVWRGQSQEGDDQAQQATAEQEAREAHRNEGKRPRVEKRPRVIVYSADPSASMQAQASDKCKKKPLLQGHEDSREDSHFRLEFLAMPADDEQLKAWWDATFFQRNIKVDVVVMSFSLMFMSDKQTCIEGIQRVLKPSGRVLTIVLRSFPMIDVVASAVQEVVGDKKWEEALPDRVTGAKLGIAGCLALREPGIVEKILREKTAYGQLGIERTELLDFAFPLNARRDDKERVCDLFGILIEDEGWKQIQRVCNVGLGGAGDGSENAGAAELELESSRQEKVNLEKERESRKDTKDLIREKIWGKVSADPRWVLQEKPDELACPDYQPYFVVAGWSA